MRDKGRPIIVKILIIVDHKNRWMKGYKVLQLYNILPHLNGTQLTKEWLGSPADILTKDGATKGTKNLSLKNSNTIRIRCRFYHKPLKL
jgi:hypothetical protein